MMCGVEEGKTFCGQNLFLSFKFVTNSNQINNLSLILLRLRCSVAECFDRGVFGR
jgi:hypothetical protein